MDLKELAKINIKKNKGDFTVYFISITMSLLLCYLFNAVSLLSLQIIQDNTSETNIGIEIYKIYILIFDIVAIIALSFLFIYINKFLINRRSKELSVYMLLGMDNIDIKVMMFYEVIYVCIYSFFSAVLIGTSVWIFLNIICFNTNIMTLFAALIKSILWTFFICCLLIYMIIIKNNRTLNKISILQLINSQKKNEKFEKKWPIINVIFLILSIAGMYKTSTYFGYDPVKYSIEGLFLNAFLGIVSVFVFYKNAAYGFFVIIKRIRGIYYRRENVFVINQIKKKLSLNCASMATTSLTMFLSMISFAYLLGIVMEGIGWYGMIYLFSFEDYSTTVIVSSMMFIIFLFYLCSVSIVSIHQVADIYENDINYKILKKMGCTKKELTRIVKKNTFIYFIIPAVITILFSLGIINRICIEFKLDVIEHTTLFIGIWMFIYFIAVFITYRGCKKAVVG